MEGYNYKIGRVEYYQAELTYGDDRAIAKLFSRLGILPDETEIAPANILAIFAQGDILGEFLGIILKPKPGFFAYAQAVKVWALRNIFRKPIPRRYILADAAANSLIGQIFEDFFLLNNALIEKLTGLGNLLALTTSKANPRAAQ